MLRSAPSRLALLALVAALAGACGGGTNGLGGNDAGGGSSGSGGSSSGSGGGSSSGSGSGSSSGGGPVDGGASSSSSGGGADGGGADAADSGTVIGSDGSVPGVPDPSQPGPYAYAELDDTATIAATGDSNAVHCAYPTSGPTPGPYPVIVFAHGFQLPPSQYYVYLQHLASFGYVALTAEFPTSLLGNDNPTEAKDLAGALDWAANKGGVLAGKVDATTAGVSGHSLGGKLAILAASIEPRFKATITLDAVNGGGPTGCTAPQCEDDTTVLPSFKIPTGFLGETTDSTSSSQACAPAADNFQTLFAVAPSPALEVDVLGANHMSFLGDPTTCGLTCSFCNAATADHAKVLSLAQSYLVAFYERYLRGNTGYDTYLTGSEAQARYVPAQAQIAWK